MALLHLALGEKFSRRPDKSCSFDASVANQGCRRASAAVGRSLGSGFKRDVMNCLAEGNDFKVSPWLLTLE
jgi:hypothetical protein